MAARAAASQSDKAPTGARTHLFVIVVVFFIIFILVVLVLLIILGISIVIVTSGAFIVRRMGSPPCCSTCQGMSNAVNAAHMSRGKDSGTVLPHSSEPPAQRKQIE